MAPVLETARLRLRGLRASDERAHALAHTDQDVVRYLGGKPFSREDSWRRLLLCAGLWDVLGYGYWCVEDPADGRFAGVVGFADFKRDLEPSIENMPEMGWVLAPWCHGRGYASEAVAAALDWGAAHLAADTYSCIIDPHNAPSLRVAEKAGFGDPVATTYKDAPILVLTRPARGGSA